MLELLPEKQHLINQDKKMEIKRLITSLLFAIIPFLINGQAKSITDYKIYYHLDSVKHSVVRLNLNAGNHSIIPNKVYDYNKLVEFKISNNKLRKVSGGLGKLTNLIYLDLSFNYLTDLPEEFRFLNRLETLILKGNMFFEFPDEILAIKSLRKLEMEPPRSISSRVMTLPTNIGILSNLESLDLRNLNLSRLPDSFYDLTKLNYLNLSVNKLKALSSQIGELVNLEKVDFSFNDNLTHLPKEIGELSNLRYIDISYTNIQVLPAELLSLPKLTRLKLSNTPLAETINTLEERIEFSEKLNKNRDYEVFIDW